MLVNNVRASSARFAICHVDGKSICTRRLRLRTRVFVCIRLIPVQKHGKNRCDTRALVRVDCWLVAGCSTNAPSCARRLILIELVWHSIELMFAKHLRHIMGAVVAAWPIVRSSVLGVYLPLIAHPVSGARKRMRLALSRTHTQAHSQLCNLMRCVRAREFYASHHQCAGRARNKK